MAIRNGQRLDQIGILLSAPDLEKAENFYCDVLGAKLAHRYTLDDGATYLGLGLHLGSAYITVARRLPTVPTFVHYVRDVDAAIDRALAAGATLIRSSKTHPIWDAPWGDRVSCIIDPAGILRRFQTRREVISFDESQERAKAERALRQSAR